MPVIVAVDHERREVNAVCIGPVTLADLVSSLEHEVRERGFSYRKFVDARGAGIRVTPEETREIVAKIGARGREEQIGPAAVVVSSDAAFESVHLVEVLSEGVCDIRVFRDEKEARDWLASRPIE